MSKKLFQDTKFLSEVKKFYATHKEFVLDIVLFGSVLKGKENPGDVDILIIYKNANEDAGYSLKKALKAKGYDADITEKSYMQLFDETFLAREAILVEGYSLIQNKYLSRGLGFTNIILFKYTLKGFSKTNSMRFYYSLYGREGSKGVLKKYDAKKFSDSIILCPIENMQSMENFFEEWHIQYQEFPILLPQRISNLIQK